MGGICQCGFSGWWPILNRQWTFRFLKYQKFLFHPRDYKLFKKEKSLQPEVLSVSYGRGGTESLGTAASDAPIVPAPDDNEFAALMMVLREKPAQCQFVLYESHMDYSRIEPGPSQLDAGLCYGMTLNRFSNSLESVCIDIVTDDCCSGTVMWCHYIT